MTNWKNTYNPTSLHLTIVVSSLTPCTKFPGIFNPIMRLHSTSLETVTKEPWAYPNGYGALIGDALRYRHSFIPYIYSLYFPFF